MIVAEDQLSLAIGKEGQNVRLAARLTGWKIDIKDPNTYAKEKESMEKAALEKAALREADLPSSSFFDQKISVSVDNEALELDNFEEEVR